MAAGTRTVKVKYTGDAKGLRTASGQAGKAVGGWRNAMGKMAAAAKVAAAAAAAAIVAAAAIAPKLLDHAAKLELMARKASVVFEDQIGAVQRWARANANAMGLTARELVGLTANFADLLKPMGFTAKEAARMSMKVNGLAGALAEWSGGTRTAAEVSEILSAAMLGERESLKGLGIAISEADVEARLLAKGQDKLTGKAKEQAEAIATMELIFEKSTDAQKAYKEGGDTLGRTLSSLKAKAKEWAEALIVKATPAIKDAIKFVGDLKEKAKDLFGDMKWADRLEDLREIWDGWVADFNQIKKAAKPLVDAFKEWAGPVIKDGLRDLRDAWTDMKAALDDPQARAGLKSLAIVLGVIVVAAIALVIGAFRGAAWIVKNVLVPVFKLLAKVSAIQMNIVLSVIEVFLRALKSVIDIAAKIPGPHQKAFRSMSKSIGGAIDKVAGLRAAINAVPPAKKVNIRFTNRKQFLAHIAQMREALRGLTNQGVRVSGVTGQGGFSERAHGGPVQAGRSYLVGERGPELLTMSGNGHVTPNHELAGALGPNEFTAEATIDLGEGISRVVEIKFKRKMRGLRRNAFAGAGAMA